MFDDLGEVDAKLQVSACLIYLMLNDRRPKSQKSWTPWRERDADLKVRKLVARYIKTRQPRACVQPCHLIVYHIIEAVVPFWDACSTQRFFQNSSLLGDQFTVTFSFTLRSSNPSKLKSSNKDKHTLTSSSRPLEMFVQHINSSRRGPLLLNQFTVSFSSTMCSSKCKRGNPRNLKSWNNDKHVYPHFQNAQWRMGISKHLVKVAIGHGECLDSGQIRTIVERRYQRSSETHHLSKLWNLQNHDEVRWICNKFWGVLR